MPHGFKGERTLMRIFIGESDRCRHGSHRGKPLYEALVAFFRERGCAGVTVLRGIAGFGAHARLHTDKILRLSLDLPIVVEVVEDEARIQSVLPELDGMIDGGLVTLERARVILYRPHDVPEDERWEHRIDGLQATDQEEAEP
jgi:PII-like signaling protein